MTHKEAAGRDDDFFKGYAAGMAAGRMAELLHVTRLLVMLAIDMHPKTVGQEAVQKVFHKRLKELQANG